MQEIVDSLLVGAVSRRQAGANAAQPSPSAQESFPPPFSEPSADEGPLPLSRSRAEWLSSLANKFTHITPIQQILSSRIDRLQPATQEVLKAASVIGVQFPMHLLMVIRPGDTAVQVQRASGRAGGRAARLCLKIGARRRSAQMKAMLRDLEQRGMIFLSGTESPVRARVSRTRPHERDGSGTPRRGPVRRWGIFGIVPCAMWCTRC